MSFSHWTLVVYLMSLDPVPLSLFLIPRLLHYSFCLVFCCITFMSISVFFEFFCSFCRSSSRQFRCPPSIVELLYTGSTYTRSISFPVFLFACISYVALRATRLSSSKSDHSHSSNRPKSIGKQDSFGFLLTFLWLFCCCYLFLGWSKKIGRIY
jgi:hypothetical protein